MPFFLGLIAVAVAAYFWMNRARNAASAVQDLAGVASDVMNAARRFGFRRAANVHPVESLEDGFVATAGVGIAFLELGGLPSADQHDALIRSLQHHLTQDHDKAQEAVILGRWLIAECGGAQQGFDRMARRLYKLQGHASFDPLMLVLKDVAATFSTGMSERQLESLEKLAVTFRLR